MPVRLTTSNFVDWHLGQSPLLIACPHNGQGQPPGVPERPDRQRGCLTKKQADSATRTIALGLADAIEAITGSTPSLVIAGFHRRYIDANRERRCAFEAQEAAPFYREYHRRIRLAIAAIKSVFSRRGMLVDVHGAADLADRPAIDVLFGSDGGKSIGRLLALDPVILWRRRGLVRTLQSAGFGVIPAEAGDPENPNFDGGFTVRRHGAAHTAGLDALQVEIVRRVRLDADRRDELISALADGLLRLLVRQKKLVEQ